MDKDGRKDGISRHIVIERGKRCERIEHTEQYIWAIDSRHC